MAKVTITFEDHEGGVEVKVGSDPAWPGPAAENQSLTEAQMMGLRVVEILNQLQEAEEDEDEGGCCHDHDHDCQHDHDH